MDQLLYGAVFVVCLAMAARKMKELSHLSLPSAEPILFQAWISFAGSAALELNWLLGFMLISIGIVVAWAGFLASGIAIIADIYECKRKFEKFPAEIIWEQWLAFGSTVLGLILETAFGVYFVGEMLTMSGGCVL